MKNKTIKILVGSCVIAICFTPINASKFEFVEENETKIETIKEGCYFTFTTLNKSIDICHRHI